MLYKSCMSVHTLKFSIRAGTCLRVPHPRYDQFLDPALKDFESFGDESWLVFLLWFVSSRKDFWVLGSSLDIEWSKWLNTHTNVTSAPAWHFRSRHDLTQVNIRLVVNWWPFDTLAICTIRGHSHKDTNCVPSSLCFLTNQNLSRPYTPFTKRVIKTK